MNPLPASSLHLNLSLGVVILAAGRSSRMGQPKLLLPWGNSSILGHLITQWRALGAEQLGIVAAADDHLLEGELDRLEVPVGERLVNPTPEGGMFSSVQCAAAWGNWRNTLTHWAVALGDQPHLRRKTLQTLLEFAARHSDRICQPAFAARRAHPVILPEREFKALGASRAANLREFLSAFPVALCPSDDPGLGLDIDHPADYERLRGQSAGPD